MTYKELYESAADKLEKSKITLGEFEKMIEPLNAEVATDSDTISRAKAIDALRTMQTYKLFAGDDMLLIDQAGAQTELMMLPPVQPAPSQVAKDISRIVENGQDMRVIGQPERIKGRWVEKPHVHGVAYCSLCDYELHTNDTNFCPNCGADMRGEQDG